MRDEDEDEELWGLLLTAYCLLLTAYGKSEDQLTYFRTR